MKTLMLFLTTAIAVLGIASSARADVHPWDYYQWTEYSLASGSYIAINDDEPFGSDEYKKFDLSGLKLGNIMQDGAGVLTISRCVGGEVRVDVALTVQRTSETESVVWSYDLRLYEGTSCTSTDLDARLTGPVIKKINTFDAYPWTLTKTLISGESGGDTGIVNLRLKTRQLH